MYTGTECAKDFKTEKTLKTSLVTSMKNTTVALTGFYCYLHSTGLL